MIALPFLTWQRCCLAQRPFDFRYSRPASEISHQPCCESGSRSGGLHLWTRVFLQNSVAFRHLTSPPLGRVMWSYWLSRFFMISPTLVTMSAARPRPPDCTKACRIGIMYSASAVRSPRGRRDRRDPVALTAVGEVV